MEQIQIEVVVLEKVEKVTEIHSIRGKTYKRAVYKHEGKFFVRGRMSYEYYLFNNLAYSEVVLINIGSGNQWYL